MDFSEKTLKTKTVYEGRVFTVKSDIALLPDGNEANREVVLHNGGVGILAIDDNKKIKLVRQYRYGVECETLEIPAGKLEAGEDALDCAKRELLEETGYTAEKIEPLGVIYPTPAYCSEKISIFLATELTAHEQRLDDDEFLEVIEMHLDDAVEMVMKNEISDAKTVAALLKAKIMLS